MKILILIFFAFSVYSAVPTMEGLFRNAINEPISGNMVVFDLMVTELPKIQEVEGQPKENFIKLVLFQEEDKNLELYQFQYSDAQMKDNGVIRFSKVSNLTAKLKGEMNIERSVFFAILKMLGLNDSYSISYILKKYNQEFKYNREILNWDKMAIYKEYKNYLQDKNKADKPSPLNPVKPEEKERVDALMKSSMYKNYGKVKQVKKDGDFYWSVELDKANALFSNEGHFLKEIMMRFPKGSMEMDFDDYVSLGGSQLFPAQIMIKDINERFYKVKILSYKISLTNPNKIQEKYKDIQTVGTAPSENVFPGIFLF